MRDVTADGRTIAAMTLEHYPGMAERELTALADDAHRRWPLDDICIIHRHGRFVSGDGIVFVATASSHRAAAFASCEFLMDWLKTKAPFWKKETLDNGEVWVAATGDDDARASRWAPGGVNPAQAAD
jgi:molybdopterin synthase catalytic subunit